MDNKVIGKKLKNLRLEKNITKKDAAKALNIPVRTLDSYELGERSPKDILKIEIAKYYSVSVEELFFS